MISPHTMDLAVTGTKISLVNVGVEVEKALAYKEALYTAIYDVKNSDFTTRAAFRKTGFLDAGGYTEAMRIFRPDYRIYCQYVLRRTGAIHQMVNHKTMLDLVYPNGLMFRCATVNETLHFVWYHRGLVRRLLQAGLGGFPKPRLIFVGDIGKTPVTHVGIVTLVKRRFRFDRELVTTRTEYSPYDLFLTRHIL